MKFFLLLILLPFSAFALPACQVGGISDSPQRMSCYIHDGMLIEKLDLSCDEGNYLLNWKGKMHEVQNAYHEEVEEGSNPLVFPANDIALTTISFQFYSRADLKIANRTMMGLCFDK